MHIATLLTLGSLWALSPLSAGRPPEAAFRAAGGLELVYAPSGRPSTCPAAGADPAAVAQAVRARLAAMGGDVPWVQPGPDGRVVVRIAAAPPARVELLRSALAGDGCLALSLFDESGRGLADPRVAERLAGWLAETGQRADTVRVVVPREGAPWLTAVTRPPLVAAVAHLAARGLLPVDRIPAFQADTLHDRCGGDIVLRWTAWLLHPPAVTAAHVADARVLREGSGALAIAVTLDDEGRRRLEAVTAAHVGERLAILVGDEVNSAPVIQERIASGRVPVALGWDRDPTPAAAEAFALVLRAGALPSLELVAERQVPPEE
jgi:hypothetical protein